MEDCLFCKIAKGEVPSAKIYEDDEFYAFLDIQPVNEGHTLVIPKRHHRDITDTPPEKVGRMFRLVGKIASVMTDVVGTDAFNIGVNVGGEAGQVIFHTHVHVMPRFEGDGHRHWSKKDVPQERMDEIAAAARGRLE